MTTRAKEHLLHRIIAASSFVFALCILPVAQYALVGLGENGDGQGAVAGVSTDRTITEQNVPAASASPDPESCSVRDQAVAKAQAQISAWNATFSTWESATNQKYDQQVIDASATLSGEALAAKAQEIAAEKHQVIASYAASVDKEVSLLSSQKEELASRSCLAG